MNKALLLLCLFFSVAVKAQQYNWAGHPNELKLNVGWFIADGTLDASYEHFLNEESSFGATIYFDAKSGEERGDFGIGPNFRVYFGPGYSDGFFVEAFGLYYTGDVPLNVLESAGFNGDDKFSTFALGIGIGHKWLTQSNRFSFELHGGGGRNLNPEDFQSEFMVRAALSVGFRF